MFIASPNYLYIILIEYYSADFLASYNFNRLYKTCHTPQQIT
ncbi:hypothetical protein MICAI_490004 [Microcystis sp. T1-4]|nr:hypothetical protein MICAI_490004 [Microcystis sp. T1-4]